VYDDSNVGMNWGVVGVVECQDSAFYEMKKETGTKCAKVGKGCRFIGSKQMGNR
jgi:hypothetical protein